MLNIPYLNIYNCSVFYLREVAYLVVFKSGLVQSSFLKSQLRAPWCIVINSIAHHMTYLQWIGQRPIKQIKLSVFPARPQLVPQTGVFCPFPFELSGQLVPVNCKRRLECSQIISKCVFLSQTIYLSFFQIFLGTMFNCTIDILTFYSFSILLSTGQKTAGKTVLFSE